MFWKLFSSERRVQQALEQSTGYDMSPNDLTDVPAEAAPAVTTASTLNLWKDYSYLMPANTQQEEKEEEHHTWTNGLFARRKG